MLQPHPATRSPYFIRFLRSYISLPYIPLFIKNICLSIDNILYKLLPQLNYNYLLSRSIPCFIIIFYITGLTTLVMPTWGINTAEGMGIIMFATIIVSLMLISFLRAAYIHPGRISQEWYNWNGVIMNRPNIPKYAIMNEEFLEMRRLHLENGMANIKPAEVEIVDHGEGTPSNSGVLIASQASSDEIQERLMSGSLMLMMDADDELPPALQTFQWNSSNECKNHNHPHDNNEKSTKKIVQHENVPNTSAKILPLHQMPQIPGFKFNINNIQFPSGFDKSKLVLPQSLQENHEIAHNGDIIMTKKSITKPIAEKKVDFDPYPTNQCTKCSPNVYKPPRTHHCSQCQQCITRMDHHCVWLNSCVGYDNHKYFLLFLFYTLIAQLIYLVLVICKMYIDQTIWLHWFTLLLTIVDLIFLKMVGQLTLTQFHLVSQNITQLEEMFHAKERLHAYDKQDIYENMSLIFGNNNVLFWLLPTKPNHK